jgi:hypothetical protein
VTDHSRERRAARVADGALVALLVVAPLAAGSWKVEVLPILGALATLAAIATAISLGAGGRSLHLTALSGGLLALAALTALQALPLDGETLRRVSPMAAEVRAYVTGSAAGPSTYEAGATLREAAKLLLYALVTWAVYERVRARKSRLELFATAVVCAGLASTGITLLHRLLGIERLFGLLELAEGASRSMYTTFVSPNHAAGFLALAALLAAGLALEAERRARRVGLLASGVVFGAVSAAMVSKGGLIALGAGLALFAALLALRARRARRQGAPSRSQAWAVIAAALLLPLLGIVWRAEEVLAEFGLGDAPRNLGLNAKFAGVRDVLPLLEEHPLVGIGRGAFVSAYARYKTSPIQLTFTFPENLVVQLLGEWGLIVGSLALLGLIVAIVIRLARAERVVALAAASGIFAVTLQNLVDFSLELPGMAIPIAVLMAGSGVGLVKHRRLQLGPRGLLAVALLGSGALAVAVAGVFSARDLDRDLLDLDRQATEVMQDVTRARPLAELEAYAAAHPANGILAAKLAFLAQLRDPPDLTAAMRWANRSMYLAPSFAGGHIVTAQILLLGGHRWQALGELRAAWALEENDQTLALVVATARDPEELLEAVPRRDEELDLVDELALSRLVLMLVREGRREHAAALVPPPERVPELSSEALLPLAAVAQRVDASDFARAALLRRSREAPDDRAATLALARLFADAGELDALDAMLARIDPGEEHAEGVLELRFRAAMGRKDWAQARASLAQLERRMRPEPGSKVRLAALEAQLEQKTGRPFAALEALDRALASDPSRVDLRVRRADILRGLERLAEAEADLELVLARAPRHPQARGMLEAVRRARALGAEAQAEKAAEPDQ